jgi:hypothetical protein
LLGNMDSWIPVMSRQAVVIELGQVTGII